MGFFPSNLHFAFCTLQWNLPVLFQTPNGYDIGTRRETRLRKDVSGIVTLITDFGLLDEYAGAMKGAILKVNPRCQVIDVTHRDRTAGCAAGRFCLEEYLPLLSHRDGPYGGC